MNAEEETIDAAISDPVQLHAGDLGEAHQESGGPPGAAARQYIETVGGKLHGFWYAFGDHDGYNLWEAPDNVSIAAATIALGAGGVGSVQITPLLTVEDTIAALRKASSIAYRPPGERG